MKARLIISVLVSLLFAQITYAQWIQTDGPVGRAGVSAIIKTNNGIFIATSCGLHKARNLAEKWEFTSPFVDIISHAQKGDSLFYGNKYEGVMMLDLSQPGSTPVSKGLMGMYTKSICVLDTCISAAFHNMGFNKSVGFSNQWQSYNDGLPIDTLVIPRWGYSLVHNVYSIEKIKNKIFCGTRKGVYKSDVNSLTWVESSNGLPIDRVDVLHACNDTLYAGIEAKMYASYDLGESWTLLHTTRSRITEIRKINGYIYIVTEQDGIFRTRGLGANLIIFNTGLTDLNVSSIRSMDSVIVCGTADGGFFYFNGNSWRNYNDGIKCSWIRSITSTGDVIIANDEDLVYRSVNGHSWQDISPDVTYELFGSVASMDDMVFLSVEYDAPYPIYDAPFILFSPDLGNTWENLAGPVPFVRDDPYRIYCENGKLYACEDEIMYCTYNLGASWTDLSLPFQFCNGFNDFIVSQGVEFAIACGAAQMLKRDQANGWILSNQGLPGSRELDALAKTSDALYVYASGTGMYVSKDNGQQWSIATSGLNLDRWPESYAYYGQNLFVATYDGVFYTNNHGQQWRPLNNGLINPKTTSITIHHDTLYVGTRGNGIWKHDLGSIPLSVFEGKDVSRPVKFYPNPASDFIYIEHEENQSVRIRIIDHTGRQVFEKELLANGMINLSAIPPGTYILKFSTDKKVLTSKLMVVK